MLKIEGKNSQNPRRTRVSKFAILEVLAVARGFVQPWKAPEKLRSVLTPPQKPLEFSRMSVMDEFEDPPALVDDDSDGESEEQTKPSPVQKRKSVTCSRH